MNHRPITYIDPRKLTPLANNPRTITKAELDRLIDSIKINGYYSHRPLGVEKNKDGQLVVLDGNQRLKAVLKLGIKEVPIMEYFDLTEDERVELILRANINNGDWDYNMLTTDDVWNGVDFDFMGLEIQETKKKKKKHDEPANEPSDGEHTQDPGNDEGVEQHESGEKEEFYRMMLKDCLYESNNSFEIPNLLLEQQAGKLELPFTPWGANSRLRKDVATYHFYVDDYRFEHLFKDPIKLLTSGCKAIVEPNCSLHDQTPIAFGIHLIYKKRWLSRYCQECGVKVYADLNVSHKFAQYNRMGIPDGYDAFMTRGTDGWIESLKIDLQTAKEISGKDRPNLIVYGGGDDVKEFCYKNSLLYVTDFINAKK